ncbi:MAG: hypothetical protein LBL07_01345 [Tannerella sp.]|nr:hypothetical protein [Tannerella sp.]
MSKNVFDSLLSSIHERRFHRDMKEAPPSGREFDATDANDLVPDRTYRYGERCLCRRLPGLPFVRGQTGGQRRSFTFPGV